MESRETAGETGRRPERRERAVQGESSIQAGPQVADTDGDDQRADQAADHEIGHAGLEPRAGVATGQAADAQGDASWPVGCCGGAWWSDKTRNVITPATEVTNVEASAAGATSDAVRPDPIKTGARIEPPPIP
jgi:hypothetical protein